MSMPGRGVGALLLLWLLVREGHTSESNSSFTNDSNNPTQYYLGSVLSSKENILYFGTILEELNFDNAALRRGVTLYNASMLMKTNPIQTALKICENLIKHKVYGIVVSHPPVGELSPAAVSYTSGFYHIPVIGISSRDSSFSDKNIHITFLRTVPPYAQQAEVWVQLLKHFQYRRVVFISSSDTEGRAILGTFQSIDHELDDDKQIEVEKVLEYEPGLQENLFEQEPELDEIQSRVYLLYASKRDAEVIFEHATAFNMTGTGYAWIVTEQALGAKNVPQGALGLTLNNAKNETAHIRDSLYVLAKALSEMYKKEDIEEAPADCNDTTKAWPTGKVFFQYIKDTVLLDGWTGKVAFDEQGDRVNAEYSVVNVQGGSLKGVGTYFYSKDLSRMALRMEDEDIIWPGGTKSQPEGYQIPTHLKVLTISEKPFVYTRKINPLKGEACDHTQGEQQCPKLRSNATDDSFPSSQLEMFCCRGYCIDLLVKLSSRINFTFDLAVSPDGQFGAFLQNPNTSSKMWTGLIGELVYERADLIVAPLTINPERAQVIDFSKPFKYQGITILEKKHPRTSTLVSFLQPFRDTLWILVMMSVHVVALVLYLLDRFSPFGRYRLANSDGTEEDALNLSSAIWFAWGVLLNSGIGEGTPRSFSARVLGMVWAGFAMIIVASYTANLAAFLVLDRPKTSLTGINDARLRNPMENFTYATVRGSSVDMYFRRQVELSNMYRTMEGNNYNTAEEAIEAVKAGDLNAFIWDSSRLMFEASQDCDLVTAGELFGRSGYGVGLRKKSPWTDKITLEILHLHESGFMEDLDNRWILQGNGNNCVSNEKTPATLGLKNMAGVFILVGAGIVGGVALIVIEIIYKKHQIRRQRRMELARHAAEKWRSVIEKRKTLRASMDAQRRLKANGMNSPPRLVGPERFPRHRVRPPSTSPIPSLQKSTQFSQDIGV